MYKIINTDLIEEEGMLIQTFTTGRISSIINIDFQNRNEGRAFAMQQDFMLDGNKLNIEETIDGRHFSDEGKSIEPTHVHDHVRRFITYCEQNNFAV